MQRSLTPHHSRTTTQAERGLPCLHLHQSSLYKCCAVPAAVHSSRVSLQGQLTACLAGLPCPELSSGAAAVIAAVVQVTFVGPGFTRKPPKYERFIRPTGKALICRTMT